jgi:uncharacterized small protein (DUF1192 family)
MTTDEEDLRPRETETGPKNLEVMSIEALEEYIAELEEEIARVRAAIEEKRKLRSGADALFKK